MLAAAYTVHLGGLGDDERGEYLADWESKLTAKSIQIERFSFIGFMANDGEMLKLKGQGLEGDELSGENAMMILKNYKVGFEMAGISVGKYAQILSSTQCL